MPLRYTWTTIIYCTSRSVRTWASDKHAGNSGWQGFHTSLSVGKGARCTLQICLVGDWTITYLQATIIRIRYSWIQQLLSRSMSLITRTKSTSCLSWTFMIPLSLDIQVSRLCIMDSGSTMYGMGVATQGQRTKNQHTHELWEEGDRVGLRSFERKPKESLNGEPLGAGLQTIYTRVHEGCTRLSVGLCTVHDIIVELGARLHDIKGGSAHSMMHRSRLL